MSESATDDIDYGDLNGHIVGTLMKEAVRRAMVAIRGHRFTFEATAKVRTAEGGRDFVTTADFAAQRVFVKLFREWFPSYGIVAEEGELRVPCTHPTHDIWFTVDPLDGTKAFMRRQSHGIGTMVALVCDGEVLGACVGDVMTQEVYTARPRGEAAHRISEFGIAELQRVDVTRSLTDQWLLLRTRPEHYSPVIRAMLDESRQPLFAGVEGSRGSIGIAMARLWKGEMGAAVLGPIASCTPWDLCPVIGISQRMGFGFYEIDADARTMTPWEPTLTKAGVPIPREVLVVHQARVDEILRWLAQLD